MAAPELTPVSAPITSRIPLQAASEDIWASKYRLKDHEGNPVDQTIADTRERVARALAQVENEADRAHWQKEFLWTLENGAIPAGRILSNAGAAAYKPATSTINCTVSGTIRDSMDDILGRLHEAGMTLKGGSGIGYEFSTLRPRGAYVSGADAFTSGPLSFMDIYDSMCLTISSAGGRRGAQMATFDVGHPDVMEFIEAKREDGRLRQFNLSLLITERFIEAVKNDEPWVLAFPLTGAEQQVEKLDLTDAAKVIWRDWPVTEGYLVNDSGLVACRIYRTLEARELWDSIMKSTYDFAEPGFILIDRVNEMNNAWFCENIRATNPCVTADTWIQTSQGPLTVADLIGQPFQAQIDGTGYPSTEQGFFRTARKSVVRLETHEGYELRLTADHPVRKVTGTSGWWVETRWFRAGDLSSGDRVLLNDHSGSANWTGSTEPGTDVPLDAPTGYLIGAALCVTEDQIVTPAVEKTSSGFYRGFLRGLFDARGCVQSHRPTGVSIRLAGSNLADQKALQRMLLRLGIASELHKDKRPDRPTIPDRNGEPSPRRATAQHVLIIAGESLPRYRESIGFTDPGKRARLDTGIASRPRHVYQASLTARVKAVTEDGVEEVYDAQVPGINAFDANGLHAHNCGEQPLPPYGACLLGSVNLTCFVLDPFTEQARFDWERFRRVVRTFTRMLDNVVEIHGLALEQQAQEIARKRRHGMGFLGLGSALAMLTHRYGDADALAFTESVTRELAVCGWQEALNLAREKGPAPIMAEMFSITPEMLRRNPRLAEDGHRVGDELSGSVLMTKYGRYMQRIAEVEPELVEALAAEGARFTHHSSIAPTGTIALSLANNASNGIEPSFAHRYARNVLREGRKTKEKIDVYSFELLAYRALVDPDADLMSVPDESSLPDYFVTTDDVSPQAHVQMQAAAQKWIDSSISKTANVPTDYPFEAFKDIYLYACDQGLKGCTTFRFNPERFQGVLVREQDLHDTVYRFTLADGSLVEFRGDEELEYEGERHTAANLYDALKEGYYGKI